MTSMFQNGKEFSFTQLFRSAKSLQTASFIVSLARRKVQCLCAFSRSPALARSVTRTMRTAIAWFSYLAVGPNAGLRVYTPVVAVVRRRHCRIGLHVQIDTLPAQRRTEIGMARIKAVEIIDNHACPPLAA